MILEEEKWKQWQILFSRAPKSLLMVTAAMKMKDACSLEEKLWQTSVQFSCHSYMSNSLQYHGLQHARLPCPWPTPGACSNSCPSSRWCHLTVSSSASPFSSCVQSFPASGSFPMKSRLFASGGQSIGASASASVLSVNSQGWSPLGWTGWISSQSKGLWRVFSNITVQKCQFFSAQLSHIHTQQY